MWVTWKKKCIFYGNVPAPCFICSGIIWVLRGVCTFAPSAHINPIGLRSLRLHSYDYSFTFCFLVQGGIPFLVFIFWTHTILNIISKCRNRMGRFSNETTLPSWISTATSYFLDSGLYHNQIFLCIHIILSTVCGFLKARMMKLFFVSFSSGERFVRTLHHDLSVLGVSIWLIVSLSSTRLWSMWWDWLAFLDCGFHSVCLLMEKDKRLMEASWWERLTEGETGSCSDGRGHAP